MTRLVAALRERRPEALAAAEEELKRITEEQARRCGQGASPRGFLF